MFEAARVHDETVHTNALAGFLVGAVLGVLLVAAAAAAVAATVCTGGLAAFVISTGVMVAADVVAGKLAELGEMIGSMFSIPAGAVLNGSFNVFTNSFPAAYAMGSMTGCVQHSVPSPVAEGSTSVFINGMPAARKGDKTACGSKINLGSHNVFIGGGQGRYLDVADEVPAWARKGFEVAKFVAGFAGGFANLGRMAFQKGLKALTPCAVKLGASMATAWAMDNYVISPAISGLTGHPVDAVTGRKLLLDTSETDFELPGYLPLSWSRFYASDLRAAGVLGAGWRLPWEMSLQRRGDFIYLSDRQGREVPFNDLAPSESVYSPDEQLWLMRSSGGHFAVRTLDDTIFYFGALDEEQPAPLSCLQDLFGHYHYFQRDEATWQVTGISTDGGVCLRLTYLEVAGGSRLHAVERIQGGQAVETLVQYRYDDSAQLIEVVDRARTVSRRFAYGPHGMTRHENALGFACHYRWAELPSGPRVVEHWTNDGERYTFDYDVPARTTRITDVLGRESVLHYNASRFPTDVTDIDGQRYRIQYDADDNITGFTLPDGRQLGFEYDDYSRLIACIDPRQRRTAYAYHFLSDRVTRFTSPEGQWQAEYDAHGALVSEQDTLSRITTYANTDDGVPYAITDPAQLTRHVRWNALAQPVETTDCSGKARVYAYDERDFLSCVTNALGETTALTYDPPGNVIEVCYPDARVDRYRYNALGQLLEHTDPTQATTRWTYTPRGLPLEQQDAQQRTRRMAYDRALRLAQLTNENGAAWTFDWDRADRLQTEIGFDGLKRQYAYTAQGQLRRLTEIGIHEQADTTEDTLDTPRPQRETHFDYDDDYRLIARRGDDYVDHITYEDHDRLTTIARTPTEAGSAKGLAPSSLGFEYDDAGRLIGEGQGDQALAYAYDELDNLTALTLPDGRQLKSLYYGSGHLLQLNLDQLAISHFERDDLHREVMRTQGALTSRFGFDRVGRKVWQFASRLDQRTLSPRQNPQTVGSEPVDHADNPIHRRYYYTAAGELQKVEDKIRPPQTFDYDRTGRLMRHWPERLREEWFGYDRAANRIIPGNDSNPRYLTLGDNRLLALDGYHYAYDGWGNTIRRARGDLDQQFDYDSDDRLIRARVYQQHELVSNTRYHYDPLGRRVRKTVTRHDPKTARSTQHQTDFVWQGLRLLAETQHRDDRPVETRVYAYEQNSYAPLARIDITGDVLNPPRVYYFHTDVLGTPKEVTDAEGELVWQADYQAWGEIERYRVNAIEQPLRFQGQYADDETGLYYTTFRYYDPHSGRFTTQDPIGLAGGWNLYQYAPNPTGWVDPWGLACTPTVKRGKHNKKPLSAKITVTRADIGTGTAPNASSRKWARSLGNPNDDAGHILAKILGGSGGKGNVFPQLPAINRGQYREFEKLIRKQLTKSGEKLDLSWEFTYANGSTRPTHVTYSVHDQGALIMQQVFKN